MGNIKKRFVDFNIKPKLIFLGFIVTTCLIFMALANHFISASLKGLIVIMHEEKVFNEHLEQSMDNLFLYEITGNEENLKESLKNLDDANNMSFTFARLDSFMNVMPREEWITYFYSIFKEGFDNDIKMAEFMGDKVNLLLKITPGNLRKTQMLAEEGFILGQKIKSSIESYSKEKTEEKLASIQVDFENVHQLSKKINTNFYSINKYLSIILDITLIILVIVLGAIIYFFTSSISKSISVPINQLTNNFKQIAKGNLKSMVNIDSKNEIGELANAFLKIQLNFQEIISHSKKVANGDYSTTLEPKSEEDELALALNTMALKLEEIKLKTEKEHWIQEGINGLDERMTGNLTVRDLSKNVITYLSSLLGFEIGAVYSFDEVLNQFELTGSVGLNINEIKQIIQPGDGLIGKVALQKSIQILDTKNKYHKIFSASGEIIPEKLYLMPLYYNNTIQSVIELAAINELSERKIEFLNIVSERIAVNLNAAIARFRNKELLEQTLEQSKILKKREEELIENQNELTDSIDKLHKIQLELQREKTLMDSLLKNFPDAVYFKDIESKFIKVSCSLPKLFGLKNQEEIYGKTDFDFFTSEHAEQAFNDEQEIIKTKKPLIGFVEKETLKDGTVRYVSTTKMPYFDEHGEVTGTFGISRDITKMMELELEIKKQNEKLQEKQNELTDAYNELTLQQEELKATNEELKAQEDELRVANEELAHQTKILSESEKSLQVQQEELRVTNEELELKTNQLEIQKKDIAEKNKILEKSRLELQQKAKELELASQYKSEFLANMSHELRTPLNSLLILSKLLGNNKEGNLTEGQVKSANIIYKSGRDLLELINEILDLSKIEAGKMDFEFNNFSIQEIITEIENGFNPVAENKGLTIEITKSEHFPTSIYSDKQRLHQIIKNLLSNAFKFTSTGGIKVNFGIPGQDAKITNPLLNSKNSYFISVEDTGVGIPESKVNAIFEAFHQADGSISRKFGGTGLGLSISKELTHVLGGEIQVESTENVGSVFTLLLPIDKELVGNAAGKTKKNTSVQSKKEGQANSAKKEMAPVVESKETELPFFIEDDRNSTLNHTMVLIIHPDKEKAKELLLQCHKKRFVSVVANNVQNGITLAEKFLPKAIIISAGLNSTKEYEQLKTNNITNRLPIHHVNRIKDNTLTELEELITPSSEENTGDEKKLVTELNQVLIIEDDPVAREAMHLLLTKEDIIIHEAKTGEQAFEMISAKKFDCVILDLGLPDFSGKELLEKLKSNKVPIPNVIIHTARELSQNEVRELNKYSESIIIKGIKSDERLMDEVSLFLHHVEVALPKNIFADTSDLHKNMGFKGKKILLVDDDIRNIFAIAQILEEKGIEVLEAENGQVAIDVLQNNKGIDLVLMDIMMPVMDGYEAMKLIRQMPEISKIPIITLTAKAMKEDFQKAIDCGANDYISKPLDVDKLFELLKIWLFI